MLLYLTEYNYEFIKIERNDLEVNKTSYVLIQKRKQTINLEILHWHDTIMCPTVKRAEQKWWFAQRGAGSSLASPDFI